MAIPEIAIFRKTAMFNEVRSSRHMANPEIAKLNDEIAIFKEEPALR